MDETKKYIEVFAVLLYLFKSFQFLLKTFECYKIYFPFINVK